MLFDSSDLAVPSFGSPAASLGSWETGWRSHDPRPSDTIAISVKNFFIEPRISITNPAYSRTE
jgi:hypothetical protein